MVRNQIKTFLLLIVLTGIFLLVGSMWGKSGLLLAFLFSIFMNMGAYFYSDKMVLRMYNAQQVDKDTKIFNLVKQIAKKAKISTPKVYIIKTHTPNAFATGRNPENSSIALTSGIINLLSEQELKGVISHEISHIKNRDTLIQVIAATIVSTIMYLAFMARFMVIFGGDEDSNILELLMLAFIIPIGATLIQLCISRNREYLADESGAKLSSGKYLADALQKLERGNKVNPLKKGNKATSSLFIVNPFSYSGFLTLLSTHPKVGDRIKRLREIN